MSNYILSYNPLAAVPSASNLAQYIKDSRIISGWHSPWLGTYLLKSEISLYPLQQSFQGLFDNTTFFIAELQPHCCGGFMNPAIWQWLNFGILPALPDWTSHG